MLSKIILSLVEHRPQGSGKGCQHAVPRSQVFVQKFNFVATFGHKFLVWNKNLNSWPQRLPGGWGSLCSACWSHTWGHIWHEHVLHSSKSMVVVGLAFYCENIQWKSYKISYKINTLVPDPVLCPLSFIHMSPCPLVSPILPMDGITFEMSIFFTQVSSLENSERYLGH